MQRHIPKETPLYDTIKSSCTSFCAANQLGGYAKHFAGVLCFDGPNAHIMASGILSPENYKPFRLDELMLIIRELGSFSQPILSYICGSVGFAAVPLHTSQTIADNNHLETDLPLGSLDLTSKLGDFSTFLRSALSDQSLDDNEKKLLAKKLLELSSVASSYLPLLDPALFASLKRATMEQVHKDTERSGPGLFDDTQDFASNFGGLDNANS